MTRQFQTRQGIGLVSVFVAMVCGVIITGLGISSVYFIKASTLEKQAIAQADIAINNQQPSAVLAEPPADEHNGAEDTKEAHQMHDQFAPPKVAPDFVLGFKMPLINGKSQPLDAYKGKVILIVNVASKCGLTPQYQALEKLYRARKKEGFVILGFPSNNFNGQEPGTNHEIALFCKEKYDVTFPMFSKISVKGENRHALYKKLTERTGKEPTWNFSKYLVDRQGRVVEMIDPRTKPDDPKLLEKIEKLIASKG